MMNKGNPMNHQKLWAPITSLICAVGATLACHVAAAAEPVARSEVTLEEVIVTAQKRNENVQTVPIAITALTPEALETRFVKNFMDISGAVPNAALEKESLSAFASSFYIRGLGTLNRGPFVDPAVSVSVDGVLGGYVSTAITDMIDIGGIEILRGPQGTLQGRNSTGGAIIVRHNNPDPRALSGSVGLLAGDYGRVDATVVLNIPMFSNQAALRVAAKTMKFDGFFKNVYDPANLVSGGRARNVGGENHTILLPSFRWESDNWDLTLRGSFNNFQDDSSVLVARYTCRVDPRLNPNTPLNDTYVNSVALRYGGAAALQYCAHEPTARDFTVNQNRSINKAQLKTNGVAVEFNRRFADVGTLTFVGGYQGNEELSALDVDSTFQQANSSLEHTRHHQATGELRFASDFSKTFDFVAGAFYLQQHYILDRNTQVDLTPLAVPQGANATLLGGSRQGNTQAGAFAQLNWHFTDSLTGVLGARYTKDKKDMQVCASSNIATTADCTVRTLNPLNRGAAEWSDTTPRFGLNYKLNDRTFLYAYWAKGFRAGGFAGEAGSALLAGPFNPESIKTTEVGAKIDGWDNKLRVNLSVFDSKVSDLQRNVSLTNPATLTASIFTLNAAAASIRGAEAEVTLIPVAALTLNLAAGYLDAKYTDYCKDLNGAAANDAALVPCAAAGLDGPGTQRTDLTGLPLARAPKLTGHLQANYDFALANGSTLSLNGEYVYIDKQLTVDSGVPFGTTLGILEFDGNYVRATRAAQNIYNASVNWKSANGKYRFSIFGKNLSNTIYDRRLGFASPTLSFGMLSNPREVGAQFSVKLGGQ
jgi:iron complex outermembrane receptor protein